MSYEASVWAYDQQGLTSSQKSVLVAVAFRAREKHGVTSCYPGHEELSKMTGLSRRTIIRAISDLEAKKLLHRERRTRSNGSRSSDRYVLNLSATVSHSQGDTMTPRQEEPKCHPVTPQGETVSQPRCHPVTPLIESEYKGSNRKVEKRSDKSETHQDQESENAQGQLIYLPQPEKPKKSQTPEQEATEIAYEHLGKAFAFIKVRGIVKWLIHERGLTVDRASQAVIDVYQMGKPITKQVMGQYIDGHLTQHRMTASQRRLQEGYEREQRILSGELDFNNTDNPYMQPRPSRAIEGGQSWTNGQQ